MKDMKKENSPSILVVSGDPIEIVILKAELEISGFHDSVFTASCSEEAFRIAAERSPALAIYEHPLDSEDGIILCRSLKRDYAVPVLVLGKQEAAERVGAEAFLPSPYVFQDFLRIVQRFVSPPAALFSQKVEGPKNLEEEEHKYQDLFDRASDIILLMDYDTHLIIDANKQAELAYEYTREELIGMSLLQIVPREQHISILQNTKRIAKEGVLHHLGERTHIKKDGTPMQVSISASLIEYGGRKIFQDIVRDETERIKAEGALKRLSDELAQTNIELQQEITGRKRVEEELRQANVRLEELDRLKSMFIATMSHELRTPLNSIIGFTGIMLMGMTGELTEEQRKQLTIVKSSASHLLDLINDIIDMSKIEAGKVELLIEQFDLSNVVQEVKDSFKVTIDKKGIELPLKTPKRLGVKSDARRVKQIIVNLVGNAVKFTDEGEVEIKVAEKDGMVEVSVRDTGPGIRKEHMERLFKAFSQIPTKGRIKEGTGLGLHLSNKIADLLGGEISAESEFGKGSTFTLTLPMEYREVKK